MKRIADIKAVGIDLDGVVYFGAKAAPGAIKAIDFFRRNGLRIFFLTNNSVKTRGEIAKKLSKMGIRAPVEDIFTAGFATAFFLTGNKKAHPRILVIGSRGLKSEIRRLGLTIVKGGPCDFLVVGYDPFFTYKKISLGLDALLKGAKFVACNLVPNFPVENNRVLPGCGAMVAAIEAASGQKPDFIIGKPDTFMLQLAAHKVRCKAKEIIFIGDSVEEDIVAANRFGSPSVLITRKIHTEKKNVYSLSKPSITATSLNDARKFLIGNKENEPSK